MHSCIIDGEVIVSDSTGLADFSLISGYRRGHCATLCAFDLIEINGEDLRWRPIEERKAALKKLIGSQASRHRVQQAFRRRRLDRVPSCLQARMRGIVSKRLGSPYRFGRSNDWIKIKNPASPAVKREAEEEWLHE